MEEEEKLTSRPKKKDELEIYQDRIKEGKCKCENRFSFISHFFGQSIVFEMKNDKGNLPMQILVSDLSCWEGDNGMPPISNSQPINTHLS